jgi:hypothetical protein
VILTPVPNSNYAFSSWSGADYADLIDVGDGTYSITMTADKEVTANFEIANHAPIARCW